MSEVVPNGRLEGEVDLGQLFEKLWAGRWLIIASTVFFATIFAIASFYIEPEYRATTVLVPASSESSGVGGAISSALGSLGGLSALAGINLGSGGGGVKEALAVLRSRQFLEKFITDRNLLPVLFEDRWDEVSKDWRRPDRPPTLAQAHKYFVTRILSVSEERNTSLIAINIRWRDSEQAAAWANELIVQLNAEMRARALANTAESMGFLENELKGTSLLGAQQAIGRLMEAQINQRMVANVTHEYALRVVDRAMPPDEGDPVYPNRPLLVVVGLAIGAFLGSITVALRRAAVR